MAGAGYKLFNTGDVLTAAQVNTYLMEQTVMVFANAAARTTALSGVVSEGMISYLKDTNAVEVYDGSNWVSSDDPNAIQNTIVDAKGDLISASAADVPARLAVGNNGETLVADSSSSTGLRWDGKQAAGRNICINGGMDIWQRGTTFNSIADGARCADRWQVGYNGSGATRNVTQQTLSPSEITGFDGQYYLRYQQTVAGTSGTFSVFVSRIEDVRTFAGRTAVVSFWAKAAASTTISTQGSQDFGSGGSSAIYSISSTNHTLTTSWVRYSATIAFPSISGKTVGTSSFIELSIGLPLNSTFTVDITGVQLELGSVATPFTRTGGTLAGELAACQRYFQRATSGNGFPLTIGQAYSSTNTFGVIRYPVTMRTAPTITISSAGNFQVFNGSLSAITATAFAQNEVDTNGSAFNFTVASGLTAGNASYIKVSNASGTFDLSSEL